MQIRPILAALRHHKAGTVLITLQIALTLAIVCNALFIIHERLARVAQPSGLDESNLLVVANQWVGNPTATQIGSLMAQDLSTLRKLPGVTSAYATNSYPFSGSGTGFGIGLIPDKYKSIADTAIYFADQNALTTLGVKLIAGRNFTSDEVGQIDRHDDIRPGEIIITRPLAEQLYPHVSAVGKLAYISAKPSVIVGVIERMRTPWPNSGDFKCDCSTFVPYRQLVTTTQYLIRTQPGQLDEVARHVRQALYSTDRMRVISARNGVQTFSQVRELAYEGDRGMAIMMGAISLILLTITAAGIVGLTSFWVGQRRRQIGVRRALGATRRDILSYFLTENFLIGMGGVVIGAVLTLALNLWLMQRFEMQRLEPDYLLVGVVLVLLLGQGAVLAPAVRASRVSPVEATRPV